MLSAVRYRFRYGRKIVVGNHHVARLFRHFRARAEREADVRLFQRGGVVDSVARHARNVSFLLSERHQAAFIRRQRARHHPQARQNRRHIFVGHCGEFVSR